LVFPGKVESFAWFKKEVQLIRKENARRRILVMMHHAPTLVKSFTRLKMMAKIKVGAGFKLTCSAERAFLGCWLAMFGFLDTRIRIQVYTG
jgi:hypothetical protein